jgi:hypothetical protein
MSKFVILCSCSRNTGFVNDGDSNRGLPRVELSALRCALAPWHFDASPAPLHSWTSIPLSFNLPVLTEYKCYSNPVKFVDRRGVRIDSYTCWCYFRVYLGILAYNWSTDVFLELSLGL